MHSVDIFENYKIYEDGRILSKSRIVDAGIRGVYRKKDCILVPNRTDNGYRRVQLRVGGKPVDKYIHRLVAENFLRNPQNLKYVRHIDGDKDNNHVDNLMWVPHG